MDKTGFQSTEPFGPFPRIREGEWAKLGWWMEPPFYPLLPFVFSSELCENSYLEIKKSSVCPAVANSRKINTQRVCFNALFPYQ